MRRIAVAAVLAAMLTVASVSPAAASHTVTHDRCSALTGELNRYRADLALRYDLCVVAVRRARLMADAGRIWHDLRPVTDMLRRHGVTCWNVGEVLAWNSYSGSARAFVDQWRASPGHWSLLTNPVYERGGGAWVNRGGRHYAAFYVLHVC